MVAPVAEPQAEVAPIPLRGHPLQAAAVVHLVDEQAIHQGAQVLAQGFALRMGQELLQCSFGGLRLLGIDHPADQLDQLGAHRRAYRFSRRFGHVLHRLTHRPPQIAAQAPPDVPYAALRFHPR